MKTKKNKLPGFMTDVVERAVESKMATQKIELMDPNAVANILMMRAEGETVSAIVRESGYSRPTIKRLLHDHEDTVNDQRKRAALNMGYASATYTDLLMKRADQLSEDDEELRKLNPKDLALTAAIMQDKSDSAAGRNTIVIEHRKGPTLDDASAVIAAAKKRIADKSRDGAIDV